MKRNILIAVLLLCLSAMAWAQDFTPPAQTIDSLEILGKITGKAKIAEEKFVLEFRNASDYNLKSITFDVYIKNLRGHVISQKEYTVLAEDAKNSISYKQDDKMLTFPAFKKQSDCTASVKTELHLGVARRLDWKLKKIEAYKDELEK